MPSFFGSLLGLNEADHRTPVERIRDEQEARDRRKVAQKERQVAKQKSRCIEQIRLLGELGEHIHANRMWQTWASVPDGGCSFEGIYYFEHASGGHSSNRLVLLKSGEWQVSQTRYMSAGGECFGRYTEQDPLFWYLISNFTPEDILRVAEREFQRWSIPLPV